MPGQTVPCEVYWEREREGQGGSRPRRGEERERDQGGLSLYMGDDVITGKGER